LKFVKTENLEKGMRLARPIYNKNGVLLYDRDTKLTKQGINSVKNFEIIGIYILEDAEPLPPITQDDIEFERFQTMSVFGLREDIELMQLGKAPSNMENMVNIIRNSYARTDKKLSTIQNLRSNEDYTYKHCLLMAIISAAMAARIKFTEREINEVIYAALIHDVGLAAVLEEEYIDENVKTILEYENRLSNKKQLEEGADKRKEILARILWVANVYDDLTSMKLEKEPISEVAAIKYLLKNVSRYGETAVGAIVNSLRMLYQGVCVELTNKSTGIVIVENEDNVLRPLVLGFRYNEMYNLMVDDVYKKVQIKDIMKTMDKRVKIDRSTIAEYMEKYGKKAL
jgi:hypothetical protein